MVPVDLKRDSVASSLPAAEEIGATLTPPRHDHRRRNRWALAIGSFLLIFIVILVVSLTLSKESNSSSSKSASSTARAADFDSVAEFLANEGISDLQDLEDDESPQNRAVLWLAEEDPQNLAVPDASKHETEGYLYVARYVMALNYFALDGERWSAKLNFLSGGDICDWRSGDWGVICSSEEGRRNIPVRIFIGPNKMTGQIPKENGHLTTIESFFIEGNNLQGKIITELCGMNSLNDLHLGNNNLSGEIPSCLSGQDLQHLFLQNNILVGSIPTELCKIDALDRMALGGNLLTGSIPSCLGDLKMLEYLYLDSNELNGSVPTELCQLPIKKLILGRNLLSKQVPGCIGNIESLTHLHLRQNQLTGELPGGLSNLKNLQYLAVDDNKLSGDPTGLFTALTSLVYLHADTNNFDGVLDDKFLANTTNLLQTDLSHNNFTSDNFPSHLLSLPILEVLDLSRNQLRGRLPIDIAPNPALNSLSLYGNDMDGPVSGAALKNWPNLIHLDLAENQFTGPMPTEIGELSLMAFLFLSNNPFTSGETPDFSKLVKLQELSLRNTNRVGLLPSYLGSFGGLDLLDLSSNEFTGSIPDAYGDLRGLKYLLLQNNGIREDLPATFGNLQSLVGAFLDRTNLTGDMDALCNLPAFGTQNNGILYADCGGSAAEVECNCDACKCCNPSNEEDSCSKPSLANIDDIVDAIYRRRVYDFEPAADEEDSTDLSQ